MAQDVERIPTPGRSPSGVEDLEARLWQAIEDLRADRISQPRHGRSPTRPGPSFESSRRRCEWPRSSSDRRAWVPVIAVRTAVKAQAG